MVSSGPVVGESAEAALPRSPEEDYERGMVLKEQGKIPEAVERFHAAARDKSLWFKAYAQVGFCYIKLREPEAAIQAFGTAADDPTAPPNELMDVLYCLGRSFESVGKTDQAREVYDRITQASPSFRDVPNRLKQLGRSPKPSGKGEEQLAETHSWFSGMIDNVQRFLIGTHK
jgi:tetratricopeptide (TPR) repeat protein